VSSLTSRVVVAVVLAPVAVYAVLVGGWVMVALALVAGITAMHEFCTITRELRPLTVAGLAGVAGIIVAIHEGGLVWSLLPLLATLLLAFWLSAVADVRQPATVQIAVTLLGVGWIGYGLGFLVAIRDIAVPDGWGKSLLLAVLLGVWSSDIAAFFGGRLIGRRKLAREISPNKTVEGLLVGLVMGTAVAFIPIYNQPPSDPISPLHALELALTIAVVSPVGDLFESYMKRDAGVKDTGRLLGGHGGMLDRVDALLFAGVAAYFVALAFGRA
jgi:phosphatidate cytidylyltransferase